MSTWFLYLLIYSFLGYCLEKCFARATRSPHQVRKCFLLLPLCPVYGMAMTTLVALAPADLAFLPLAALGAAVCTAAEYLVHLFCDRVLGVWFWDYRALRGNLRGRICPQFTVIWGVLSALAVRWLHPAVAALAACVPVEMTYTLWLLLTADSVASAALLRRYHQIDLLAIPAFFAQIRASGQSSTSR